MANKTTAVLVVLVAIFASSAAGRELLQSSAPPSVDFGGPSVPVPSAITPPAGSTLKVTWHAVGTQNYTSASNSQYTSFGAMADLFQPTGTKVVSQHFFIQNAAGGLSPVFTKVDPTTGALQGTVIGKAAANVTAPAQNDDGGFGSVPWLLLEAVSADGFFQGVTHIQRTNTLGGVVPTGMFTLPAFNGLADKLLTVPYQADYQFFTQGGAPVSSTG